MISVLLLDCPADVSTRLSALPDEAWRFYAVPTIESASRRLASEPIGAVVVRHSLASAILALRRAAGRDFPVVAILPKGGVANEAILIPGVDEYVEASTIADIFGFRIERLVAATAARRQLTQELAWREMHEAGSQRQFDRYARVFEAVGEGLIVFDETGAVLDINSAAARLFGYRADELRCKTADDLFQGASDGAFHQFVDAVRSTGAFQGTTSHRRKDGTTFEAEMTGALLQDDVCCRVLAVLRDLGQESRASVALRESEPCDRSLLESIDLGIAVIDKSYRIVSANSARARFHGLHDQDLAGRRCFEVAFGRTQPCEGCVGSRAMATGRPAEREVSLTKGDGSRIEARLCCSPMHDTNGEPTGFVEVIQDVTESKRAAERLRDSLARYRALFEAARDAVVLRDAEGHAVDCNSAAVDMFGFTNREEMLGTTPVDIAAPMQPGGEARKLAAEYIARASEEPVVRFEWQQRRLDGVEFTSEVVLSRIDLGDRILVQSVIRDLSHRKTMELALRESERRYRQYIDNAPMAIFVSNEEGRYIEVNSSACHVTGYSEAELLTLGMTDLVIVPQAILDYRQRLRQAGHATGGEFEFRRRDGTTLWMTVDSVCTPTNGCVAFCVDVTARKAAEQAMLASEGKLRAISDAALDAIVMIDDLGRIVHWNPAAQRMFGYRPEEILYHDARTIVASDTDSGDSSKTLFGHTSHGNVVGRTLELEGQHANGWAIPIEVSLAPLTLDRANWAVALIRDVTRRKQADTQLQQYTVALESANEALREYCAAAEAASQAKSRFLANMSHELRTPLHGILSFAAFGIKRSDSASRDDLLRYFNRVDQSARTLLALVNDLLDLSKLESGKAQFNFESANLAAIVDSTVNEFAALAAQRQLKLAVHKPTEGVRCTVDAEKIGQVVRNLMSNAIKFSPPDTLIEVNVGVNQGRVRLTVADRGVGVPEDELETIFDEFVQSTKTRTGAGGTGLGLAICRNIVAAHRGRIWAANRPDGGAEVTFEFPCQFDATEPAADSPETPAAAANG